MGINNNLSGIILFIMFSISYGYFLPTSRSVKISTQQRHEVFMVSGGSRSGGGGGGSTKLDRKTGTRLIPT